MTKKQLTAVIFAVLLLSLNVFAQQQWVRVSLSRQANISGMALIDHSKGHSSFLIVHDNKKKDQNRVGIISIDGDATTYAPLKWAGDELPKDLEAVTSIPGVPNQFILLAAAGRAYHVSLNAKDSRIDVIRSFDIPSIPKEASFEGFALQKIGNTMVVVWADRGLNDRPATLFTALFDAEKDSFSDVKFVTFRVPYPTENIRHITDIKVDPAGRVYVTSASDPGNDGPFSSAMYLAGTVARKKEKSVAFTQSKDLTRLYTFDLHKVEGFEFIPGPDGGVVFGTDDENLGASLWLTH